MKQNVATDEVTPDTVVITIPGVCDAPAAHPKDCKTEITRAQFDALAAALGEGNPEGITKEKRSRLGQQYAEMLVYSKEAEKRGIDKEPSTELLVRFARVQVLTQRLLQAVQKQSQPTPEDIKKYYAEHSTEYQGISVQRIMIPLGHKGEGTKPEDVKTLAEETRKKLVAGEDPAKLQQEVYTKLGFKIEPPETALIVRANSLPPDQQSVTKLKPGEVSQVFSENETLTIYKFEGLKPLPLEQASEEIRGTLEEQKVQDAGKAIRDGHQPVLNVIYFSPHQ
jgi:hypothetical protein